MIRHTLQSQLEPVLTDYLESLPGYFDNSEANGGSNPLDNCRLERPRHKDHGDYAINVSSLAKWAKAAPPAIAEALKNQLSGALPDTQFQTSMAAGFLNFTVQQPLLANTLLSLVQSKSPGKNQAMANISMLLEYVSANPTGPLHIGHGRWAALGNSIQRILEHCGATVTPEFYVNDAGVQMNNIAGSLWYRSLEILGTGGKLPEPVEGEKYPFYPGEYVIEMAQDYLADDTNKDKIIAWDQAATNHTPPEEALADLIAYAKKSMLAEQKALLDKCGVPFENWFSEKEYLHERGLVEEGLEKLKASGFTYKKEGALWFQSSEFGDEKDRVLIKSDGQFTYLAADIAYHHHKFSREGVEGTPQYNRIVNIWGADHHGYIPRMRGAIEALGHPVNEFEILLGQLVNLIVDGEKARMGKRRKMLTLADVVEEVGVDATRFWMVNKSADTTLDFDVNLAASATDENPVYYVQYAHARCAGILRNATQDNVNVATGEKAPALLTEEALKAYEQNLTADHLSAMLDNLDSDEARQRVKDLILKLDQFEDLVVDAANLRAPHLLARYALELSADFHGLYNVCRILTPDADVTLGRLMVIIALKKILAQTLYLLGVSAPDRM